MKDVTVVYTYVDEEFRKREERRLAEEQRQIETEERAQKAELMLRLLCTAHRIPLADIGTAEAMAHWMMKARQP